MAYVTLTTDVKNFYKPASLTAATGTTPSPTLTTTSPATTVPSNSTVVGTSLSYLKVKAYSNTSGDSVTLTCIGWSFWSDTMTWVPQVLFVCTTTQNTNAQTIAGVSGNVYECTQFSKSTGDAKIYNSAASTANGGFFLVDTLGCQFVQFHASTAANNPTIHIFTSGV